MAEFAIADFLINNGPGASESAAAANDEEREQEDGDEGVAETEKQMMELACRMQDTLVSRLHDAAARNNEDLLKELLDREPDSLNRPDNAGNTPAHWAAGAGALDTLTLLLDRDCDVAATNLLGDTPLHRAVWRNQRMAVALMINRGMVDITVRNSQGHLAVDLARDPEIASMLKHLVPLKSVNPAMLVPDADLEDDDESPQFPSSDEDNDDVREHVFNVITTDDGTGQSFIYADPTTVPDDLPPLEDV